MKPSKIKITNVSKLTQYNHLNLYDIKYNDRYNKNKSWILASRSGREPRCITKEDKKPDAVIIVPFHIDKQKLVLIREYRIAINDYQIGFPAGLTEKGETIHETSSREMMEETGLTITKFIKTSPVIYSSTGITDEAVSLVYVKCKGEPSNSKNEGSEDISVFFVSQNEALKLCNDKSLKFDIKTWVILSTYAKTGEI